MAKLTGKYALAEKGDRSFNIINNTLLVIFSLVIIYPLWFVIICSFSEPDAISTGKVLLWPVGFNVDGYTELLDTDTVWIGYRNTLIYAVISTVWMLIRLLPAAYALTRRDLPGRRWITLFFMLTMYFSGGMVPKFVMISNMGWFNNPAAILFTGAIGASALVIVRSYFDTNIPDALFDAARIDGCSYTRFFLRVVLPLSGPIIAIQVLGSVQGAFNTYLDAEMYLKDQKYWTLQQAIRRIATATTEFQGDPALMTPEEWAEFEALSRKAKLIKYTSVIVGSVPMIVLYPFIQRYFVKGIMVGSVKG